MNYYLSRKYISIYISMKDFQFSFLIDHESMMFKDEFFFFFFLFLHNDFGIFRKPKKSFSKDF